METASTTASARAELGDRGVLTVTLTRPHHRNPLDAGVFEVLREAFGTRAHQRDVRVVVVRGEGDHFSAGLDRALLAGIAESGGIDRQSGEALQQTLLAVETCPCPTLAVVQGACIGGGVELILGCDFRVASSDAYFALMEMRYAFLPDLGGIHRLQREVGLSRAKEAVYFGEPLSAATYERWGVLNEVVERAALEDCAARWTARCAEAAPLAVAAAKRLMQRDPAGADVEGSLRVALHENLDHLLRSDDFREGLNAAMERRPPRFRGE
jgi:enoyl-CoA hydratase/carnithine racemase